MTPLRLLHFRVSHYNEKVRWALDHKRWPHIRTALVPGFHIPRVRWLTGGHQVPVVVIDGAAIAGSNHILVELERRCPDPPLFPHDPKLRQRALSIERFFDEEVAPDLRRLFWSTYLGDPAACARMATDGFSTRVRMIWRMCFPFMRPLLVQNMGADRTRIKQARKRLRSHFDRLGSEIGSSGYLVGDTFSVADLAAASIMTAIIRPPEFSYPLPETWPQQLHELRDSVADTIGFRWVLDVYARHRGTSSEIKSADAMSAT